MRTLDRNLLGERAEATFNSVATALGFITARLWSNCRPFDFFVALGRHVNRVQVKSTRYFSRSRYRVNCYKSRKQRYTLRDTDFLAIYIEPADAWYIIPIRALRGKMNLAFHPDGPARRAKWEKYRDRWDLLRR